MRDFLSDALQGCSGAFVDGFRSRAQSISDLCDRLVAISSKMADDSKHLQEEFEKREAEWKKEDQDMQDMLRDMREHFSETQRQCEQQLAEFRQRTNPTTDGHERPSNDNEGVNDETNSFYL